MRAPLAIGFLLSWPALALAHSAHAPAWSFSPWVTAPLAISGLFYASGVARLWSRAGWGRGVRPAQAALFALGWISLGLALTSPLHRLGERLFTAHMIEHEILMVIAAPLIVVAHPVGAMMWGLPARLRRMAGALGRSRAIARLREVALDPLFATLLHGAALWAWHFPSLYAAALSSDAAHWAQHASFLGTALLFWWAILRRGTAAYGASVFYLFATALHSGFLGILLSVAREPVYPAQTAAAAEWGLTPLEDQQLAGLIMWVPAGAIYAAAALACAGIWIARSGARAAKGGDHALVRR